MLLHGWGAGPLCWRRQTEHFAQRGRVLTPALAAWDAGWLSGYLEALPLAETVAVGWSLGGMILLEAVARRGLKPAGIVLVGAPAVFCRRPDHPWGQPASVVRAMRRVLKDGAGEVVANFARLCLGRGETEWQPEAAACFPVAGDVEQLQKGLDYLLHQDLRGLLPQIETPATIIQGRDDGIVPPEAGEYLAAHLPRADLRLIPGTGHLPFVTRADMVNAILEEALDGIDLG